MIDLIKHVVPEYNDDERSLLALDESWADYHRALRTGVRVRIREGQPHFRGGSLVQASAVLDIHHDEFKAGDAGALIDALRVACDENVPLPYWLADGIRAALAELHSNPTKTLHSVFGMDSKDRYPISKTKDPKRPLKARRDWDTKQRLYMSASLLIARDGMQKGVAIKQAIKSLPIQFRMACKWFKEMEDRQQKHLRAWRGVKLHKL